MVIRYLQISSWQNAIFVSYNWPYGCNLWKLFEKVDNKLYFTSCKKHENLGQVFANLLARHWVFFIAMNGLNLWKLLYEDDDKLHVTSYERHENLVKIFENIIGLHWVSFLLRSSLFTIVWTVVISGSYFGGGWQQIVFHFVQETDLVW